MNNLEQPPKTIEEVGIHLFYMAKAMKDLHDSVKDSSKHYAQKEVTDDHEMRITKLETTNLAELLARRIQTSRVFKLRDQR